MKKGSLVSRFHNEDTNYTTVCSVLMAEKYFNNEKHPPLYDGHGLA